MPKLQPETPEPVEQRDNEDIVAELEEKHGKVAAFEFDDGSLIVIANPKLAHVEYKRFVNAAADGTADKGQAQEDLALVCVVHPDQKTAKALLRKWPSAVGELASAARELMSGGMRKLGKASRNSNQTT
jgi:hypothetical protein